MRGFNKAVIMGNLARDPEVRYTTAKQAVAKLTVAVNRSWKDKDGTVKDDCDFIPVVVWGATAENAERYLKKGKPVLVEGRIQVRNYENQQGQKVWITEIVAQSLIYLPSKPEQDSFGFGEDYQKEPVPDVSEMSDEDADIPF